MSVPAVAAAITAFARRSSNESRLLLRLERRAAIYPHRPEGLMQEGFAKNEWRRCGVSDPLHTLGIPAPPEKRSTARWLTYDSSSRMR